MPFVGLETAPSQAYPKNSTTPALSCSYSTCICLVMLATVRMMNNLDASRYRGIQVETGSLGGRNPFSSLISDEDED